MGHGSKFHCSNVHILQWMKTHENGGFLEETADRRRPPNVYFHNQRKVFKTTRIGCSSMRETQTSPTHTLHFLGVLGSAQSHAYVSTQVLWIQDLRGYGTGLWPSRFIGINLKGKSKVFYITRRAMS